MTKKIPQQFKQKEIQSFAPKSKKVRSEKIPMDDKSWIKIGLKLIAKNRFNDAIKCFNNALVINPYNINAIHQKGKCLIWLEDTNKGLECFDRAFEIKDDEMDFEDERGSFPNYDRETVGDDNGSLVVNNEFESLFLDFIKSNPEEILKALKTGSKYDIYNRTKRFIGGDLRNRINHTTINDQLNDIGPGDDRTTLNLSANEQIDQHMIDDPVISGLQTSSEPLEVAHDYHYTHQIGDFETSIHPHDGGIQTENKHFLEQFFQHQRTEINYALNALIDQHGGYFHYSIEPKYLFRISMLLLEIAIVDFQMDGVIITVDKPVRIIRKILRRVCKTKYEPFYIDCHSVDGNFNQSYDIIGNGISGTKNFNNEDNIIYLEQNYDFTELRDAIEISIQKAAELYEGEKHFVFFDNIAAFQDFTSEREIRKFITKFSSDLMKLNLYGFFMIPKGRINLSILETLRNFPTAISNKLSSWKKTG